jgi:drug/metabolite transporter (DMT)-like permease
VRQLTVLQIAATACLFTLVWVGLHAWGFFATDLPPAVARETAPLVWSGRVVWQLVYMATIATVGAFLCWTWAQARTSATHAAIIFSLEPVFATIFAVAVIGAGEWMGTRGFVGAGLVFAGIIISEMRWSERRERKANDKARAAEVT